MCFETAARQSQLASPVLSPDGRAVKLVYRSTCAQLCIVPSARALLARRLARPNSCNEKVDRQAVTYGAARRTLIRPGLALDVEEG